MFFMNKYLLCSKRNKRQNSSFRLFSNRSQNLILTKSGKQLFVFPEIANNLFR